MFLFVGRVQARPAKPGFPLLAFRLSGHGTATETPKWKPKLAYTWRSRCQPKLGNGSQKPDFWGEQPVGRQVAHAERMGITFVETTKNYYHI
jgi:hypothetical protein